MPSIRSASPVPQAYDVFNGDADGICALHQLRLACPRQATLVTGVKRDIGLLRHVPSKPGLEVTVLDISLDVNIADLRRLLDAGAQVHYFDHHSAQQAFRHPRLNLHWDEAPEVCTSILVDRSLRGQFRQWAVVAAFGDNLAKAGYALAQQLGLNESHTIALEQLGFMLNYNAYGDQIDDLPIAPNLLYQALHHFVEPLHFIAEAPEYRLLADNYQSDSVRMQGIRPHWQSACGAIYVLPCEAWARRVSGTFANAQTRGGYSCAVLNEMTDGSYLVSVRSGVPATQPANDFCHQFPSGGGRRLAAGINRLPSDQLDRFVQCFCAYFGQSGTNLSKKGQVDAS